MTTATTTTARPYIIRASRSYYGPRSEYYTVTHLCGTPITFATRAEARAHIAELDACPYELAHGESSRPSYTARRAR